MHASIHHFCHRLSCTQSHNGAVAHPSYLTESTLDKSPYMRLFEVKRFLFAWLMSCWKKNEEEKKTSSSYNVGQFANNPRKDTYPEELIGLVILTFTV